MDGETAHGRNVREMESKAITLICARGKEKRWKTQDKIVI